MFWKKPVYYDQVDEYADRKGIRYEFAASRDRQYLYKFGRMCRIKHIVDISDNELRMFFTHMQTYPSPRYYNDAKKALKQVLHYYKLRGYPVIYESKLLHA